MRSCHKVSLRYTTGTILSRHRIQHRSVGVCFVRTNQILAIPFLPTVTAWCCTESESDVPYVGRSFYCLVVELREFHPHVRTEGRQVRCRAVKIYGTVVVVELLQYHHAVTVE